MLWHIWKSHLQRKKDTAFVFRKYLGQEQNKWIFCQKNIVIILEENNNLFHKINQEQNRSCWVGDIYLIACFTARLSRWFMNWGALKVPANLYENYQAILRLQFCFSGVICQDCGEKAHDAVWLICTMETCAFQVTTWRRMVAGLFLHPSLLSILVSPHWQILRLLLKSCTFQKIIFCEVNIGAWTSGAPLFRFGSQRPTSWDPGLREFGLDRSGRQRVALIVSLSWHLLWAVE